MKSKGLTFLLIILNILRSLNGSYGSDHENRTKGSLPAVGTDGIIKSTHDRRFYRGIILKNDLKVLLIHDPATITSAASMVVRAGALNEFGSKLDMVYLLEQVLLSSTREEPKQLESFDIFVRTNFGDVRTATHEHEQSFSFKIESEKFLIALRRFSVFFSKSLPSDLTELQEELEIKLSRLHRRATPECLRILQVERRMCKEGHPFDHYLFSGFEMLEKYPSLKVDVIANKLREFYSTWYSSNLMSLVVLGRESLDELQKVVETFFENIPNKKVHGLVFSYEEHPLNSGHLMREIYIVPIKKGVQLLRLVFPVPSVFDEDYASTAPEVYISDLIHQRGPGSLFSVLQEENLSEDVNAQYENAAGIAFFTISCNLTDEGVKNVDVAIKLIFQYLYFLDEDGIRESYFKETKAMDKLAFFYNDNEEWNPISYVEFLGSAMHDYQIEDVLSFELFRDVWNPTVIKTFLSYLVPQNVNITVVSESFIDRAKLREPWFDTRYDVKTISDSQIQEWSQRDSIHRFTFPQENGWIPKDFGTVPLSAGAFEKPRLIQKTQLSQIWFKQDGKFQIPTLHVHFEIFCPVIRFSSIYRALADIYVEMLRGSLEKSAYAAERAGLVWNVELTDFGLDVNLSGYNDKLPNLLEIIMSTITSIKIDQNEKDFQNIKKKCLRTLLDFYIEESYVQAHMYSKHLFTESGWTVDDKIAAMEYVEYKDLKKFLPLLFSRVFIQGLIHGNCSNEKALDIIFCIEKPFMIVKTALPQQLLQPRILEMNDGSNFIYNALSGSTSIYNYFYASYQLEIKSVRNYVIYSLFTLIVEPLTTTLLAPQQHPIMLWPIIQLNNMISFLIVSESEESPHQMDSVVAEQFIQTASDLLNQMSDSQFASWKSQLRTRMEGEKQSQTLKTLSEEYWQEITDRSYNFDKFDLEMETLDTIEKSEVVTMFSEYLEKSAPKRHKLAVHVYPKRTRVDRKSLKYAPPEADIITDILAFKNTSFLLPHTSPHNSSVDPLGTAPVFERPKLFPKKSSLSSRLRNSLSIKYRQAPLKKILSMSKENSSMLPEDIRPFDNQVGGHIFLKQKRTKGIMKDAEGHVLKPIPHSGPGEIYFYEHLETTDDPVLLKLKTFVPPYLGIMTVNFKDEGDVVCVRMEDVTRGFKEPCILDVKIGVQTWEPTASRDKIARKSRRFSALKDNLGFGIPGFRYYDVTENRIVRAGKDFCKTISAEKAVQEVYNFLNGDIGIRYGLIEIILGRLREIEEWFQEQTKFYFFSSSVLLVYDAQKLISFMENEKKGIAVFDDEPKIKVYFIDFAHAIPNPGNIDTNCLTSLQYLIFLFENFIEIYQMSLTSKISLPQLMREKLETEGNKI